MTAYVDGPADWVRQQPLRFEEATMHLAMLRADRHALELLCERMVNGPSGGRVEVEPLLSGVLLCFASIERGFSVPEADTGFLSENECVFFVPVRGRRGVPFRFGALVPLAYVDNPIAVVAGREIYGFPKFPAAPVHIDPEAGRYEVTSFAQVAFAHDQKAGPAVVVRVHREGGVFHTTDLPGTLEDLAPALADPLLGELDVASADFLEAEGIETLGLLDVLRTVNLLFLKQFRDGGNPHEAAWQEILTAPARISNPGWPRLQSGKYTVEFPPLARPAIPKWLGLDQRNQISRIVTLRMDFEFGAGTRLWTSGAM